MAAIEQRRPRRKWFEAEQGLPGDPEFTTEVSHAAPVEEWQHDRHTAGPKPPLADKQETAARPRVRQLHTRKPALPPEARAPTSFRRQAVVSAESCKSVVSERRPRPPTAPCHSMQSCTRLNKGKTAVPTTMSAPGPNTGSSHKTSYRVLLRSNNTDDCSTAGNKAARSSTAVCSILLHAVDSDMAVAKGNLSNSTIRLTCIGSRHSHAADSGQASDVQGKQQPRRQSASQPTRSARLQQLKGTLQLLQQQEKQYEQAAHQALGQMSPVSGSYSSMGGLRYSSTTQQLSWAQRETAAAAAIAIQDVLMVDRAAELVQEFRFLQRKVMSATSSAQQMQSVEAFLATCRKLQQTINTAGSLQQQEQHALHKMQSAAQQLQLSSAPQHHQPCVTPNAVKDAEAAGRDDQHGPWSGNITTNALFVSTPSTCCRGVTSPQGNAASPAVAVRMQGKAADGSENFNPLQSALKCIKPGIQEKQQMQVTSPPRVHQPLASMQVLQSLQDEMLQWFVQYVEDCSRCQPASKADCLGVLKVLIKVQEWLTQQQDTHDGRVGAARPQQVEAHRGSVPRDSLSPVPRTPELFGCNKGKTCANSGSDVDHLTPHLQQLHTAVRKKLTHFAYLRCQLPG